MWSEPFAPYSGPKPSRVQEEKERKRLQKLRAEGQALPATVDVEAKPEQLRRRVSHFVMNLPDSAIQFLDAFRGVLSRANTGERDLSGLYDEASMPMIHTHCFTRELEPTKAEEDIRQVSVPRKHMSRSESGGTEWPIYFRGWKRRLGMSWEKTRRTIGSVRWLLRRRCIVSASGFRTQSRLRHDSPLQTMPAEIQFSFSSRPMGHHQLGVCAGAEFT